MIRLISEWTSNYPEFWETAEKRNRWFISLRFYAVLSLFTFIIPGRYIFDFRMTFIQEIVLLAAAGFILIYNIYLLKALPLIGKIPGKFNQMHLSFLQMILDTSTLIIIVYFTGGFYSPFYLFFIFHMIIGSLILPDYIVYIIASIIVVLFGTVIILEHFHIIPLFKIDGLIIQSDIHRFNLDIIFILIFSAMLYFSVFLASKITKKLFERERQLFESLENERKAEVAKQKYIMGVVHEIKSPISAAKSLTELVAKKYLGPIPENIEEKLKRATVRMDESLEMINNILQISKLRLMQKTAEEKAPLDDIISNLIKRVQDKANSNKVKVEFKNKAEDSVYIWGDRVLIELAISNLVSNAIKYNFEWGKVIVELDGDDDNVYIHIDDNGVGIPEKELKNIFDQFYRASNIRSNTKYEGSGLGLSLVKEIIEKHGGTIEVVSPSRITEKNRTGTSVTLSFPKVNGMKKEEYN